MLISRSGVVSRGAAQNVRLGRWVGEDRRFWARRRARTGESPAELVRLLAVLKSAGLAGASQQQLLDVARYEMRMTSAGR